MKSSVAIHNKATNASIKNARIYRYNIPFNQPLLFNQEWLSHRQGFIIELVFTDETKGYGEAAPLKGFSRESLSECEQLLHLALKQLVAGEPVNIVPSAAKFAVDCALDKIPYQFQTEQSANVPLLVGSSSTILTKYEALHCPNRVKLKVARDNLATDVKNITALLARNKNISFNLDANRAWSIEQAIEFSNSIPRQAINYIEEPCHSLTQSLHFAEQTKIGIALDESLQASDFVFTAHSAIKALIIKPSIIGSFERCLGFIEQAIKAGIPYSLSSSYESSFGISQLQYLAGNWPLNEEKHGVKLETVEASGGFDTLGPLSLDIMSDSNRNVPVMQLNELELICQY